jgi:hypothetical protein
MDYDDVRPLIFSVAELDRMRRTSMRVGCLIGDATRWRPHVDFTSDGEMVFYRLEMSGPYETGRYRDGKATDPPGSTDRSGSWWDRIRRRLGR